MYYRFSKLVKTHQWLKYFWRLLLKYWFCKKYFDRNEPLTSWTFCPSFFPSSAPDLEKTEDKVFNWHGQRFILTKVTFYKIHILVNFPQMHERGKAVEVGLIVNQTCQKKILCGKIFSINLINFRKK